MRSAPRGISRASRYCACAEPADDVARTIYAANFPARVIHEQRDIPIMSRSNLKALESLTNYSDPPVSVRRARS